MVVKMEIRLVEEIGLDGFFRYLDRHLRENGSGSAHVFQPMSFEESKLTSALEYSFSSAIRLQLNEPGWRRLFVAVEGDVVLGHIDVRAHPEKHTSHRALLGMGVDSSVRGKGLGSQLIAVLTDWVSSNTDIEYIDLWVLSGNLPAITLYAKCDFVRCGEIEDKFRIDGRSHSYTLMSLHLTP